MAESALYEPKFHHTFQQGFARYGRLNLPASRTMPSRSRTKCASASTGVTMKETSGSPSAS